MDSTNPTRPKTNNISRMHLTWTPAFCRGQLAAPRQLSSVLPLFGGMFFPPEPKGPVHWNSWRVNPDMERPTRKTRRETKLLYEIAQKFNQTTKWVCQITKQSFKAGISFCIQEEKVQISTRFVVLPHTVIYGFLPKATVISQIPSQI